MDLQDGVGFRTRQIARFSHIKIFRSHMPIVPGSKLIGWANLTEHSRATLDIISALVLSAFQLVELIDGPLTEGRELSLRHCDHGLNLPNLRSPLLLTLL